MSSESKIWKTGVPPPDAAAEPAFLDLEIGYNKEPDAETIRSPRCVLRDQVARISP